MFDLCFKSMDFTIAGFALPTFISIQMRRSKHVFWTDRDRQRLLRLLLHYTDARKTTQWWLIVDSFPGRTVQLIKLYYHNIVVKQM